MALTRSYRALFVLLVPLLLAGLDARAVINANSQTNTVAPGNGVPWGHVGYLGGASGVYLGGGWVITAAHVGPGNFSLDGVIYAYSGTSRRLTNSDGSNTDLLMFKLAGLPNLSRLGVSSNTPAVGTTVDIIGWGRIAAGPETSINGSTGFRWTSYGFKSWANNKVTGYTTRDFGMGPLTTFQTDFTSTVANRTSGEGQAAQGDSGGGVFVLRDGVWQLAGLVITISVKQPDAAIYGDTTFMADLSKYRAQINALMGATIPSLAISRSATSIEVSWPDTGVSWTLQGSPTVSPPVWSDFGPSTSINNGRVVATVAPANPARFFRLRK